MTMRSALITKEIRELMWPWMAFLSAGIVLIFWRSPLSLWNPQSLDPRDLMEILIFAAAPLLAALVFGMEFQHRTMGLLLTQPIGRDAIWRSKVMATVVAVIPIALLSAIIRLTKPHEATDWLLLISCVLVATASAIPCTLLARSAMGGSILTVCSIWFALTLCLIFESFSMYGRVSPTFIGHVDAPFSSGFTLLPLAVVLLYSTVMVWLGRRIFLRFQAVEGMQLAEGTILGARLVPQVASELFRCQPSSPLLNLVRREFRLLRYIWPLTLLSLTAWFSLVVFHILPLREDAASRDHLPLVALVVSLNVLIAVLAGCLSLGEEKTWGTYDWQLTLPLSPSWQWAIKLGVALFTGLICGALLPLAVLKAAGGHASAYLSPGFLWSWPLGMAGITLTTFWCASLTKGTVRAAILAFPACLAVYAAGWLGDWLLRATSLMTGPIHWLVSVWGPVNAGRFVSRAFAAGILEERVIVLLLAALLGTAMIQSHRLFHQQANDGVGRVLRYLIPLFLITFTSSAANSLFFDLAKETHREEERMARGLDQVIQKAITENASAGPFRLDGTKLAANLDLDDATKRWVAGSTIIVVPRPSYVMAPIHEFLLGFLKFSESGLRVQPYAAVMRFQDSSCSISDRNWSNKAEVFAATCD